MVKFLLTESLAQRVADTFNSLNQSSLDPLPPKTRLAFTKLSSRLTGARVNTANPPDQDETEEGVLWIDHSSLLLLSNAAAQLSAHQAVTARPDNTSTLFSFLRSSQMYFKPKPMREKSDELKATLERIQLEKDRQAYSDMICLKSPGGSLSLGDMIGSTSTDVETEKEDWKQVRKSLTLIVNILFSVLGTIIALFWLLHHSYRFPFEHAVLSSFFIGLVVFFVELVLYWNFF
ncbi:hypothetical protein VP01_2900g3 [Puccinia sorghi]|uniref:Uncharacterized protein n=1 Tax=Puccinia sorghi TaxID=27349 RepID=A0A0L6V1I5_9BASI|nr:hypothetical protein VP01_2900g3 [Puccinia sorghi]